MVTNVVQVEPVALEGDIIGTPDGMSDTDSDCGTVGLDDVTGAQNSNYNTVDSDDDCEEVVVHDGEIPGRDEQTLSIQDFADREYQA